jgi:Tfp pilus assembly protein PilN
MKDRINFLDWMQREYQVRARRNKLITFLCLVGILLIGGHYGLLRAKIAKESKNYTELKKRLENVQTEGVAFQQIVNKKKRLVDDVQRLEETLERIRNTGLSPANGRRLLVAIAEKIPPALVLDSLEFRSALSQAGDKGETEKTRTIELEGEAYSQQELWLFVSRLEESPLFGSVRFDHASLEMDKSKGEEPGYKFKMSVQVEGGYDEDTRS